MATHPNPTQPANEPPLTYEEAWDLLWSLEGSLKDAFPEEGGASEVLRRERELWGE